MHEYGYEPKPLVNLSVYITDLLSLNQDSFTRKNFSIQLTPHAPADFWPGNRQKGCKINYSPFKPMTLIF